LPFVDSVPSLNIIMGWFPSIRDASELSSMLELLYQDFAITDSSEDKEHRYVAANHNIQLGSIFWHPVLSRKQTRLKENGNVRESESE
jgi:hypothetical protein